MDAQKASEEAMGRVISLGRSEHSTFPTFPPQMAVEPGESGSSAGDASKSGASPKVKREMGGEESREGQPLMDVRKAKKLRRQA